MCMGPCSVSPVIRRFACRAVRAMSACHPRGAPPSVAIRSVLAPTCDVSCCPFHVDSIWVSAECTVKVPQSNDVPD